MMMMMMMIIVIITEANETSSISSYAFHLSCQYLRGNLC